MSRYRHEYKYLLDAPLEALIRLRAQALLRPDPHAGPNGSYRVRSVYFDTPEDLCLRENLEGADPRSKFRIRCYNRDASHPVLEKKSKRRGLCLKESCSLTPEECETLLAGRPVTVLPQMPPGKQALLTELLLRELRPICIVSYERIPFVYRGGNVRVTLDRKLTSSRDIGRFPDGDFLQRPVFAPGQSLLEVKWDEMLPPHLKENLQLDVLQWTAFSKYALCRMAHL